MLEINTEIYNFKNKRLTGANLKLFFVNKEKFNDIKILEIIKLAAFIEDNDLSESNYIKIIERCGSYGMDISMKLNKPEIINYQEVFIFNNNVEYKSIFRAISQKIIWRNFDKSSVDDLN